MNLLENGTPSGVALDRPTMRYELFGIHPEEGQWRWAEERARRAILNYQTFQDQYEPELSLDDYYGLIRQEEGRSLDFVRLDPEGTVQYYVPPQELPDIVGRLDGSKYLR